MTERWGLHFSGPEGKSFELEVDIENKQYSIKNEKGDVVIFPDLEDLEHKLYFAVAEVFNTGGKQDNAIR